MALLRALLAAVVSFAFAGYAVDCSPTATSDEAMQCCETMPCASHCAEHSQDCCTTMPSMHAPFVQAPSTHGVSFSLVVLALPASRQAGLMESSVHIFTTNCHAPPIPDAANFSPLRI